MDLGIIYIQFNYVAGLLWLILAALIARNDSKTAMITAGIILFIGLSHIIMAIYQFIVRYHYLFT